MQGSRGRTGPLVLWEGAFLAWIGLCYLVVCRRYGLTISPADGAVSYAIFTLPSLAGGFIAWSLLSAGLRVRRENGGGGARLLLVGLVVALLVLGGELLVMALFGSVPVQAG